MNSDILEKREAKKVSYPITTALAACITAPRTTELQMVELGKVADDEVLIRMEGCGLCASSIPVWEGRDWFDYPQEAGAPGHEGFGTIAAIGKNVSHLKIGDRVTALSYHAFAEYDKAKASQVVVIPDEMSDVDFPGEPLGCAMNIFSRSEIKAGQTVTVIGAGFLGALLIQLSRNAGARVIAVSRRPWSLKVAEEMGAHHTILIEDRQKVINEVHEITGGKWCERVIEATGKQEPLDIATEIIAERGRLIVAGFHQDGPRQVNMQQWNWRGIDVINAHERDPQNYIQGMKDAIEAYRNKQMDHRPLLTHHYKLEDLDKAFEDLTSRPEGFVKGIIKF